MKNLSQSIIQTYFCFFICISIGCTSCSQQSRKINKIFTQVEAIVENHPDSALKLLDSIPAPELLNKRQYYEYCLLNIQAKDKNYMDITDDTLIYSVAEYFEQKGDIPKAALAYFYSSRVKEAQNNMATAIDLLLKSKTYAEQVPDNNLLGLIHFDLAQIYRRQHYFEKAISQMNIAREYFIKANNKKNAIYTLGRIGDLYLFMQPSHSDSALLYNQKALEYAKINNDTTEILGTLRAIAVAYEEAKDYKKAKQYVMQAISMDEKETQDFANYRSLAQTMIAANQIDSALYYMQIISPNMQYSNNLYNRASYYYFLYKIYKKKNQYDITLRYLEEASDMADSIRAKNHRENIIVAQRKYEKSLLQNQYMKKHYQAQVLTNILFSVILVISILVWIIYAVKKRKDRKIQEVEGALTTLQYIQKDKTNQLKQYFVEKLDITKKLISYQSVNHEKCGKVLKEYNNLFGETPVKLLEWNNFYHLINELHNNFVPRLQHKFPNLEEKELKICCLIRAELKNDEIAYFLGYKYASLQVIRCKLKNKLGFESMEEFKNFIDQF